MICYQVIWKRRNGTTGTQQFGTQHEATAFYNTLRRRGTPSAAVWEMRRYA